MRRPVCALLLLLAASCAEITSEGELCTEAESNANDPKCGRPLDLAYITAAIFVPSCGQTQCHSTFHQAGGLAFDTPHVARVSLLAEDSGPLLSFDGDRHDPTRLFDASGTGNTVPFLLRWLTEEFPVADVPDPKTGKFRTDTSRMPFDAPLAEADLELIKVWIQEEIRSDDPRGREPRPGASARGAQCNPSSFGGYACDYRSDTEQWVRVKCDDDFNFGAVEEVCDGYCALTEICTVPVEPTAECPEFIFAAVCM